MKKIIQLAKSTMCGKNKEDIYPKTTASAVSVIGGNGEETTLDKVLPIVIEVDSDGYEDEDTGAYTLDFTGEELSNMLKLNSEITIHIKYSSITRVFKFSEEVTSQLTWVSIGSLHTNTMYIGTISKSSNEFMIDKYVLADAGTVSSIDARLSKVESVTGGHLILISSNGSFVSNKDSVDDLINLVVTNKVEKLYNTHLSMITSGQNVNLSIERFTIDNQGGEDIYNFIFGVSFLNDNNQYKYIKASISSYDTSFTITSETIATLQ